MRSERIRNLMRTTRWLVVVMSPVGGAKWQEPGLSTTISPMYRRYSRWPSRPRVLPLPLRQVRLSNLFRNHQQSSAQAVGQSGARSSHFLPIYAPTIYTPSLEGHEGQAKPVGARPLHFQDRKTHLAKNSNGHKKGVYSRKSSHVCNVAAPLGVLVRTCK